MTTAIGSAAAPLLECDVVMKGGITSGVIYPTALKTLSETYRFKGMGGASAGAIGAALGAAAEHGRADGGFERLGKLPATLGGGALMRLFQAEQPTRPMLRLMLAATSASGPKGIAVFKAIVRSFPIALLVGAAPGVAALVFGLRQHGAARAVVIALAVVTIVLGLVIAALFRTYRVLTGKVTANNFGICTGLRLKGSKDPGFTDWLSDQIDTLAGDHGDGPLTFGQLWTGTATAAPVEPDDRNVDLRMVTTCLSEGEPFELPWKGGRYFLDEAEWRTLFPKAVVDHLVEHARVSGDEQEDQRLAAHQPRLTRMPLPEQLPVIVATRMSLSFPLLISAIPMWTINRRTDEVVKVWFTDGGLCNNFPVQLFDSALPTRPTFAINLGRFGADADEHADEQRNVRWATNNNSRLAPRVGSIPHTGLTAVTGFAGMAFNAARNWTDVSQLDQPGYRDRIVEVLQTKSQGGMNLDMQADTINRLAARGAAAATVMVGQFNEPQYVNMGTGWDNHRWVRYRALLAAFPDWLASFRRGADVLAIDPATPPSYGMSTPVVEVADKITTALQWLGAELDAVDPAVLETLQREPNPGSVLRRVPTL